jgi:hypothetical protein
LPPGSLIRIPTAWLKQKPAPVEVISSRGTVRWLSAGATEYQDVAAWQTLQMGDRLKTGESGFILLRFADGSTLQLEPNSELHFNYLSYDKDQGMVDTLLRLQRGSSQSKVQSKGLQQQRFQLETPAGIAAVRGTRFRNQLQLDSKQNSSLLTEVLSGKVAILKDNEEVEVSEGFGHIAIAGEPLAKPVSLPLAPQLSAWTSPQALPLTMQWPTVTGAAFYQLTIKNPGDASIVLQQLSVAPEQVLAGLADGDYLVVVQAINPQGLRGLESSQPLSVATPATENLAPESEEDGFNWMNVLHGLLLVGIIIGL